MRNEYTVCFRAHSLGWFFLPLLVVATGSIARSADWASNLNNMSLLVVEGTITLINAPLITPDRVNWSGNQSIPDFEFKADQEIFGQPTDSSLTFKKFVFNWPTELVLYKKGSRCVLLFQKTTYTNELALLSVLPAGRDPWSKVSSREALKRELKSHLITQLPDSPATRKQAELIHTLSVLLAPSETEKLLADYMTSSNPLVRHAAIGAIICKIPSNENIEFAKRDITPCLSEVNGCVSIGRGGTEAVGKMRDEIGVLYYDCLPGPVPEQKPLADLWHWIQNEDRQKNPNAWPYK